MLQTSARAGVLSLPPWRGVAHAAYASRWCGDPAVTGGQDSSDGTASGESR
jgi:hypothetical protein